MNALIESFNVWGERFVGFAWPMLWQSSVLIAVLLALDSILRRRVRATVRYALWMLVPVKLLLPTSLSLPTSPGYWMSAPTVLDAALAIEPVREPQPLPQPLPAIEYEPIQPAVVPDWSLAQFTASLAPSSPSPLTLIRWPVLVVLSWLFGVAALLVLVVLRGRMAWRMLPNAAEAPADLLALAAECAGRLRLRSRVQVKLSEAVATPVVCGLFRPVILLPRRLPGQLDAGQLRAVLLHELAHVRRGDLWVSHLQTALQVLHFFNPLLWLANARIRRVREEAVDEMVLVALADAAEVYPETLLKLAKRAVQQPRLAFGLIGILESKSSLGQRIRLMLLRPWPKTARLGIKGIIALSLLAVTLLPMSCTHRESHSSSGQPLDDGTANSSRLALTNVLSDPQFKPLLSATADFADTDSTVLLNTSPRVSLASASGTSLERDRALRIDEQGRYWLNTRELGLDELTRAVANAQANSSGSIYVRVAENAPPSAVARFARVCDELGVVAAVIREPSTSVAATNSTERAALVGNPRRLTIQRKLNSIVLEEVKFDHPLGEVVRWLQREARLRDPERTGINFMISRRADALASPALPRSDPLGRAVEIPGGPAPDSGLPQTARLDSQSGFPDLENIQIRLQLSHVSIADLLDHIVGASGRPIKYVVADYDAVGEYGVILTPASAETTQPLYTKFFKVDPNTVPRKLQGGGFGWGGFGFEPASPPLGAHDIAASLRDYFSALGVEFAPPKTMFYNDGGGLLMVRTTMQDMEIIEDGLHVLNTPPPQVLIEARIIEIPAADLRLPERGLVVGGMEFTNAVNLKDGSVRASMLIGWPNDQPKRPPFFGETNRPFATFAPIAGAICVLTEAQTREFIRGRETVPGTELVVPPRVVTLSQRPAQLEVTDFKTISHGVRAEAMASPGVRSSGDLYSTNAIPLGLIVNAMPTVEAGGMIISLSALVTVNEFLGYDESASGLQAYINGQPQQVKLPLPRLRVRQMTAARARLFDGQTLLLAGPKVEELFKRADGTTGVETAKPTGKHLIVLITPTIIDPAGNPIHTDADMPFRTNSIPPQQFPVPPR